MSEEKQKNTPRKIVTTIGIIVLVASLLIAGLFAVAILPGRSAAVTPDFQTLLPGSKSISELGGWKRVSPPNTEPVYAYTDSIDTISIIVSQQAMPQSFTGNINDQVTELANRFNASAEIDAQGVIIYIGTSSKGPQSVIFTKKNLLILIKSQQRIEDGAWSAYVKSLN